MSGGDIAKVAVPLALTAVTGAAAAPLAAGMSGAIGAEAAAILAPALVGAASGAVGSAITGGDPLTGAALGGVGGGISGSGVLDGMFGATAPEVAATTGNTAGASATSLTDGSLLPAGYESPALTGSFDTTAGAAGTPFASVSPFSAALSSPAPAAESGLGLGSLMSSKYALPAAGGLAVLATSGGEDDSEPLKRDERPINNVAPLERNMVQSDPNAYFGIGGSRSSFERANPQTVYLAEGGFAGMADERERRAAQQARYAPETDFRGNKGSGNGKYGPGGDKYGYSSQYGTWDKMDAMQAQIDAFNKKQETLKTTPARQITQADPNSFFGQRADAGAGPSRSPVFNVSRTPRASRPNVYSQPIRFADGGNVKGIGSLVTGHGDGQSDDIPALLSDGEYVIPSPVVAALGRGSNKAGAKKLDKMKSTVMKKTYKGGKPPSAGMGLGSMRTA